MSGTAGGSSGKFGSTMLQADLARRGALAGSDIQSGANAAQLGFSGAQLATNLLGQNFGSTSSSTGTGSTTGSQSGWNIGANGGAQFNPASGWAPR